MIRLEPHAAGVVVPLRAVPGARRNSLGGIQDGALKVSVTQVAEKGKANRAVLELFCKTLNLKKSQVELLAGETSRNKLLLVRGISLADLRALLDRLNS